MPSVLPDSLAPRRVLIVEDGEDCLQTMMVLVGMQGCEVRVARDGETALSIAREFLPHVILLDLGLPVMDGFEATAKIRSDPRLMHTIIVAVTGYGMDADKVRSAQAGVDLHLVKPVAFDDLARLLHLQGVEPQDRQSESGRQVHG